MIGKDSTKGQQELFPKLQKFFKGPDKYFLLTGKPGVGKTFIMRLVLSVLLEEEKKHGRMLVAGICLAHQAKNQLRDSIPSVFTFAKAYGLVEAYDENTGIREFVIDKNNRDKVCVGEMPLRVFVHDEVSQYTNKMLDIVEKNTSFESKVVFIGDKAQLPPIEKNRIDPDADSPVFDWAWHDENSHDLDERVRQAKGNPILEFSDLIRDEIFGNQNIQRIKFMLSQHQLKDGVGYQQISEDELFDKFKELSNSSEIVISHTNDRVNDLNNRIRTMFFGNTIESLVKDDIVYMKENWVKLDPEGYPEYKLENSEVFKIFHTQKYKDVLSIVGIRAEVECYLCKLYDSDYLFYAPTRMGLLHYNKFIEQIYQKAKAKRITWEAYWDFIRRYCSYNYAYAITSYKCQGSTYDNVFIDINNILGCRPLTPKRKLQSIYTAMTRARFGVYFIK